MPVKFSIYDSHNRFDINVMVEFTEPEEKHKNKIWKNADVKEKKAGRPHPAYSLIEEKEWAIYDFDESPARFA